MPKQSERDKVYFEIAEELQKGRDVDEVIVEYSKKIPLCKTPSDQIRLVKAVENVERKKLTKNKTFKLYQQVQQHRRYIRLLQLENQRFRRKYYSLKALTYEKAKIVIESSSEESDVSDSETKEIYSNSEL